jgi:tRNA (guanine37-N1)-methyltransferase
VHIHVVTAFAKTFDGFLQESILKRAIEKDIVRITLHHIRDFATDKHQQIDDYPYGGGPGMILKPEPIFACLEHVREEYGLKDTKITLLAPTGPSYDQKKAVEFSLRDSMILLCGHYKGIDQRVIDELVDEEISIGDYVLTGGELAAMVIIDSVARLVPGVIGDIDSAITDSFQTGLLDHPHYTRPENFRGHLVPPVLMSGNHAAIEEWRHQKALELTRERRDDLYNKYKI